MVITFLSCKKKETTEPTPTPNPTPTTPTILYNGLLLSQEIAIVNSGTISSNSGQNVAYFLSGGFTATGEGVGDFVNAGAVSLNTGSLKDIGGYYMDTTFTIFNSPLAWSVSGGNGFPAFTYTYTGTRPTYTGWSTLQDTIKLNQNTVINLTGITGADEISIHVTGGSGGVSKVVSGTTTSVSFTTSELSAMTPSSSSSLFIYCTKSSIVGIGGKNFNFKVEYLLYKSIVTQ